MASASASRSAASMTSAPPAPAAAASAKSDGLRRLEHAASKFPSLVIGQLVMQTHSHDYGIEPEALGRPVSLEESKKLLEFIQMAFSSTDWFASNKVTNIQAFKNIGWSMHCYDPTIPFIDPNQLNKRANHLKKLYKDVMQTLHENGVERYLDASGNWIGDVDPNDGTPVLRSKNNKRRRLEYFRLSHKIPRWVESFRYDPDPAATALSLLGKDKGKKRRGGSESDKKRLAAARGMDGVELLQRIMELVSGEGSGKQLPEHVAAWGVDDVYRWATGTADLSMEDAEVLSAAHIDGRALMVLASGGERRIKDVPNLSFQGVLRLVDALLERTAHFFPEQHPPADQPPPPEDDRPATSQPLALLNSVQQVQSAVPAPMPVRPTQ